MRLSVVANLASVGGRWLEVAPERFPRWIDSFGERHSADPLGSSVTVAVTSEDVIFTAPDGAIARCLPPFWGPHDAPPADADASPGETARAIASHALAERAVGVLLVRLGGYARRREKQASEALKAAAGAAAEVFGRWGGGTHGAGLDVVVLGGDKRAVADVSGDPRLAPYLKLATDRFLTVPDPKLVVLRDAPRLFLAVRIFLTEPAS